MLPKQKVVLISGAGSGIGRALSIEGAKRGMTLVLAGRRQDALEETRALLSAGVSHVVVPTDITRKDDREHLVSAISNTYGSLDILFNNAGVVEGGPLDSCSDDVIARTFATNVMAPISLTRDLLPLLLAAKPSRVVNIGSIFGDIGYPGFACYSATKFALRGFSIALRRELEARGVGVTYAAPRATKTDAATVFAKLISETKMSMDSPDDVARAIWDAVVSGRDSVYAPAPERIYVLIQRLFPRLIDWSLARQVQ
jgi:short-subunit dehydrogenase